MRGVRSARQFDDVERADLLARTRSDVELVRPADADRANDGIEDAFMEKASVVWYWHEGKWLQLAGAN
jgi:hypothetical protein